MKIARCHKDAFLIVGLSAALLACTPTAPPSAGSETFQPNPGAGAIYIVRGLDPVFLGGASPDAGETPALPGLCVRLQSIQKRIPALPPRAGAPHDLESGA